MKIALIVGGLIVAYVIFNIFFSGKGKTRDESLLDLEKFLEGKLELIKGIENSFRLSFTFEGIALSFEDLEVQGFNDKVNKGFLKAKTVSSLNLTFSEKIAGQGTRSKMIIASDLEANPGQADIKINMPKYLQDLEVHTNDKVMVNRLFQDPRIINIFSEYKNFNLRGSPLMPLSVKEGVVHLEFYETDMMKPSIVALRKDIPSIEKILAKMSVLVKKIDALDRDDESPIKKMKR